MGELACVHHLAAAATRQCPRCGPVCDECAHRIYLAQGFADKCLACEAMLTALDPRVAGRDRAADRTSEGFLRRLPEFLAFPVQRSVLYMMLGLAVITAPLYWAIANNISGPLAFFGLLIVKGLEASIYFRFVARTAYGETEIDPPDFTDFFSDLLAPLFHYLLALLPILLAILWAGNSMGSYLWAFVAFEVDPTFLFELPGPGILFALGLALLPLLTIIAAVSGSASTVLDPRVWVQSLRVMGPTYALAAVCFYVVLLVESLVWVPLLLDLRAEHSIPIVTAVVTSALAYLPMALRARILGGLVEPFFGDLGR